MRVCMHSKRIDVTKGASWFTRRLRVDKHTFTRTHTYTHALNVHGSRVTYV